MRAVRRGRALLPRSASGAAQGWWGGGSNPGVSGPRARPGGLYRRQAGEGRRMCTGAVVEKGGAAGWKDRSHLEVPRHDVSLLLGLGGYTYTSFKPWVYSTPVAAPGAQRDAFVSFCFTTSLFNFLKQELATLPNAGLKIEVLRSLPWKQGQVLRSPP